MQLNEIKLLVSEELKTTRRNVLAVVVVVVVFSSSTDQIKSELGQTESKPNE
jgi:hypothetical protein